MKVTMIRKAFNLADWKCRFEEMKKRFLINQDEVVIEKTVIVSNIEYKKLLDELLADRPYITANLKSMYVDDDNVWHCIEITTRDSDTSLLVESEGYSYARYTAIINK